MVQKDMSPREFPWHCECGRLNMIDMEKLDGRYHEKGIILSVGFTCSCARWNAVIYSTKSLNKAMQRLEDMDVNRRDFRYHFAKAMRRAQALRDKIES